MTDMFLCCRKNDYKINESFQGDNVKYEICIYDSTNKENIITLENITVNKAKNILNFLNKNNNYFQFKNIYDQRVYNLNKYYIEEILKLNKHRGISFFSNTSRYNLMIECLRSIVNNVQYKDLVCNGHGFLGTNKNQYIAKIRRTEYST